MLLAEGSTLAAIAGLILATILQWRRPPYSWQSTRRLPWALAVALLAHSAAVIAIDDHWLPALMIALAAAILYWRGVPWYRHEPGLTVLRTALATILILIGAVAYLARGGSGSTASAGSHPAGQDSPSAAPAAGAAGGDYTGVILIPETQKHVTLVPPLPAMRSEIFKKPDDPPLTIPFFGVYWFFRPPDWRPPPNSVTVRGTPEDFRFRSVGRAPLKMEAHQNLGKLINTSCCSSIQVAIHNVENRIEVSRIELILANSSNPLERGGVPPESLGVQSLDGSEHQVLTFPMRPNSGLEQFDDLTVRVLRGWILAGDAPSARISIERFVLLPRRRLAL